MLKPKLKSNFRPEGFKQTLLLKNEVVKDTKRFWLPNVITISIVAIQISLLIIFRKLPPQVPLLYSQKWGESRLVDPSFLWIAPSICVGMVVVNYVLLRFTSSDELLQRLIFWTMPVFSFLLLATLFNIILISL